MSKKAAKPVHEKDPGTPAVKAAKTTRPRVEILRPRENEEWEHEAPGVIEVEILDCPQPSEVGLVILSSFEPYVLWQGTMTVMPGVRSRVAVTHKFRDDRRNARALQIHKGGEHTITVMAWDAEHPPRKGHPKTYPARERVKVRAK